MKRIILITQLTTKRVRSEKYTYRTSLRLYENRTSTMSKRSKSVKITNREIKTNGNKSDFKTSLFH